MDCGIIKKIGSPAREEKIGGAQWEESRRVTRWLALGAFFPFGAESERLLGLLKEGAPERKFAPRTWPWRLPLTRRPSACLQKPQTAQVKLQTPPWSTPATLLQPAELVVHSTFHTCCLFHRVTNACGRLACTSPLTLNRSHEHVWHRALRISVVTV
jgi:hypothetical protein